VRQKYGRAYPDQAPNSDNREGTVRRKEQELTATPIKPDPEEVERITDEILGVLMGDDDKISNLVDALEALTQTFVVLMGVSCRDCRRNIAKGLKRRIPHMIAEAHAFAEQNPSKVHTH
jgi:hypothetical protein